MIESSLLHKFSPSVGRAVKTTQQIPDTASQKTKVIEQFLEDADSPQVQSQLESTMRQSDVADSTLYSPPLTFLSLDSVVVPGHVLGNVLLWCHESTLVTLRLAGGKVLCEGITFYHIVKPKTLTLVSLRLAGVRVECEAINMPETLKVNSLTLEFAICAVKQNGSKHLLVHNSSKSPRRLKQGTYI